jgi:hypothetical protein
MTVSLLLSLALLSVCADAAFAHTAAIEVGGGNRYKAIRLTPPIYNAANSDLSDILIKNAAGENVPYFIHTGFQKSDVSEETYPLELIQSYVKEDSFFFDYKLAEARDSDTLATSVEFVTKNTDFAKPVDIYGSHDNIHWEFVQNDKIYAIDGKSKLRLDFLQPQKSTHYRFRLANNLERIAFDAATLIYSLETSEEIYFVENLTPTFDVESKDQHTHIIIDGLKNLRLCDISISSDSMFKRTASAPQGISKEIYNLSLNGASYADLTLPLHWRISPEEKYVVTISDYDDKPIDISGVHVRYYADEVIFEGSADESYTLEFGADVSAVAPVYDIEGYKNEILKGTIDQAAIGEIRYAAADGRPPERDYRLLFNVVVAVTALLLGVVILIKLKH